MSGRGAIAAVLILAGLAVLWAWLALGAEEPRPAAGDETRPFDESRGAADLAARKRALLACYGSVDREKGIVRIPIERAMEMAIERAAKAAKEREEEMKEEAKEEKKKEPEGK